MSDKILPSELREIAEQLRVHPTTPHEYMTADALISAADQMDALNKATAHYNEYTEAYGRQRETDQMRIDALTKALEAASAPRLLMHPDGTIKPLMPAIKLPQRFFADSIGPTEYADNGVYMHACDVLECLLAAGVTIEGDV